MPRLSGTKPSIHFEDRTDQSAFEGSLRYLLDPHSKPIRQQDANVADLAQDPELRNYGQYLSHWLSQMSPDELRAMREGHYNLQDARFVRGIKAYGPGELDPEFLKMYYGKRP